MERFKWFQKYFFQICYSGVFGNVYTYFQLRGVKYLNRETRQHIIYGLILIPAIATVLYMFLRPVHRNTNQIHPKLIIDNSPLKELKTVWRVFRSKEMLILCLTFCYVGLQQAFVYGIFGPSIGFTLQFGNKAKELIPISGIIVAIGETLCGLWQLIQGTHLSKLQWGRRIVLVFGISLEIISFALVFINLPESAVFGDTEDKAIIDSNMYLVLLCSLLFGFGDGCLNTQIYAIMAVIFPDKVAHSNALYKCVKAVFVSLTYFLSSRIHLHYLLLLFTIVGIIGAIAYIYVDKTAVKLNNIKKTAPT